MREWYGLEVVRATKGRGTGDGSLAGARWTGDGKPTTEQLMTENRKPFVGERYRRRGS